MVQHFSLVFLVLNVIFIRFVYNSGNTYILYFKAVGLLRLNTAGGGFALVGGAVFKTVVALLPVLGKFDSYAPPPN